jgi:hypothetical protein
VCSLVLGAVRTIAKRLGAPFERTNVRTLAGVRPLVDFEILQPRESFSTTRPLILEKYFIFIYLIYFLLTVHLFGFSPEWTLIWISNLYLALKGRQERGQFFQWQANSYEPLRASITWKRSMCRTSDFWSLKFRVQLFQLHFSTLPVYMKKKV